MASIESQRYISLSWRRVMQEFYASALYQVNNMECAYALLDASRIAVERLTEVWFPVVVLDILVVIKLDMYPYALIPDALANTKRKFNQYSHFLNAVISALCNSTSNQSPSDLHDYDSTLASSIRIEDIPNEWNSIEHFQRIFEENHEHFLVKYRNEIGTKLCETIESHQLTMYDLMNSALNKVYQQYIIRSSLEDIGAREVASIEGSWPLIPSKIMQTNNEIPKIVKNAINSIDKKTIREIMRKNAIIRTNMSQR